MRNTQNKKNNKILKTIIISTVLAIICELISSFIINKTNNIQIYKIIIESAIIIFIGLHFTVGIKKLYNFLIENRYKLSVILIIVSTVMGFLENSMELKEWLVTKDVSLCLWWNIKFYSLLLATYELFLIITNNKNISIIGTIVIAFSGTVQWNFNYIDALIIGEIITVLINKLLETSKVKKQILLPITISIAIICYTYTQTSFAISFGYVFIALIIWIFIKNKEYLKKNKFLRILAIAPFLFGIIGCFIARLIIEYNSEFFGENTYGINYLFSYLYNILLPFSNAPFKEEFGNFFSLFPIPLLMSLYYLFKYEEHTEFLFPIAIVTVLETIFCISGLPEILGKISLFTYVDTIKCSMAVNLANVFIMFYMMANINKELFKTKHAMRITILVTCLLVFVKFPTDFSSRGYLFIYIIELCSTIFLFLNFEDKKYKKVLLSLLVIFVLCGGITVNPILKDRTAPLIRPVQEILPQ